jgi:hypothetical protein
LSADGKTVMATVDNGRTDAQLAEYEREDYQTPALLEVGILAGSVGGSVIGEDELSGCSSRVPLPLAGSASP